MFIVFYGVCMSRPVELLPAVVLTPPVPDHSEGGACHDIWRDIIMSAFVG